MNEQLSCTLTVDDGLRSTLQQDEGALVVARAYVIDSPEMASLANGELRAVKSRIKRLKELKEGFVAPAKQIVENAAALFNPALTALADAERTLKIALDTWVSEQERIVEEARRKAAAEERARRQKAEAEAAAARAKAEAEAAEQRRLAAEAEAKRRQAEADGNAKAAARAAAEAAKASERAVAVETNAEAKATELVLAAEAVAPVVEAPQKIAGFSRRENWVAELAPDTTEAQALTAIVQAIAGGRAELLALVKLDMSAASKLAKAQKGLMSVPGLVAMNRPVAASRAA